MIRWWNQTQIWQRLVIFGLAMVLFVLGMHTWVWSSLNSSIVRLDQDIAGLTQKNQDSIKSIALLSDVEQEVAILREKLSPRIQHLPVRVAPQAFRRNVVDIGKRTGVAVRLWKPKKSFMKIDPSDVPLDIVVRVEGSFYGTVQFLNELLQLSWIQTVNPLVLDEKNLELAIPSTVMTDFTIHVLATRDLQQAQEESRNLRCWHQIAEDDPLTCTWMNHEGLIWCSKVSRNTCASNKSLQLSGSYSSVVLIGNPLRQWNFTVFEFPQKANRFYEESCFALAHAVQGMIMKISVIHFKPINKPRSFSLASSKKLRILNHQKNPSNLN